MQRSMLLRLVVIALSVGLVTGMTQAQDANLLRDGGFEGTYTNRGRADLNIPTDWSIWIAESPHTESWMNLPPVVFPHNGPDPAPHGGARSLNLNKGYATFTAAVYQQVSVPDGSNVTSSAWAFLRTCEIPEGSDRCSSSGEANPFTRIGIDPNGGTNPFDSDVVWSANAAPHESWQQMTISATATGGTVTLFVYSTQQWPAEINNVYWDDASLSVGGSGGVAAPAPGAPTPLPTVPPEVPFVNAQGGKADGSIVHIVQAGDTLDSIAVAYGKTREEILAINNIANPRFIQIGQEILIQPPTEATPEVTEEAALPESTAAAESTSEAVPDGESTAEPAGAVPTQAEPTFQPTAAPPPEVINAAPAPVISVASGEVVYPIDPEQNAASICVMLFEDLNSNRIQDNGENPLADGNIVLTTDGATVDEHLTETQPDPYCFEGLSTGDYVVLGSAPPGYGLTTPDQLRVQAYSGAQINVAFGAAQGIEPVVPPPADSGGIVSAENSTQTDTRAPASALPDNIGLIVFGAAGVVLVAGLGISLLLRRR